MNPYLSKVIAGMIAVVVMISFLQSASARSYNVPGQTLEEAGACLHIMASDDESLVTAYLSDESPIVREVACRQLAEIGGLSSIAALEDITVNSDEESEVRNSASFAIWKIRYREALDTGRDDLRRTPEEILLDIVDVYSASDIYMDIDFESDPNLFNPLSGSWYIETITETYTHYYGYDDYGYDDYGYDEYTIGFTFYKSYPSEGFSMSLLRDVYFQEGTFEAELEIGPEAGNIEKAKVLLYFGLDAEQNGFALCFDGGQETGQTLAIHKVLKGEIDWNIDPIAPISPHSLTSEIYIQEQFTLSLELSGASVTVSIDGENMLSAILPNANDSAGSLALGTFDSSVPVLFHNVFVQGKQKIREQSSINKTSETLAWAIELLGDMGSKEAISRLKDIERGGYSSYFIELARENLALIDFLNSFAPGTDIMEIIDAGLASDELRIGVWAIDALVKENPPDLMERLRQVLDGTFGGNYQLTIYAASVLEQAEEDARWSTIEFLYPEDGAVVKFEQILIRGYALGVPFYDQVTLKPGENVYLKEARDEDGSAISKQITIYYENEPPVLEPIGDREISVGETIEITLKASDPDDEEVIYFADNLPNAAVFDYDTQTFSWTPTLEGSYQVRFWVNDGWGKRDEEEITIIVSEVVVLLPPSNLTASAISPLQVDLTWVDNSDNETGFKIERSLSSTSGFTQIDELKQANVTTYNNTTGLSPGTEYFYRIRAFNDAGDSDYSNVISATTLLANRAPVLAAIGNKSIDEGQLLQFTISATDPDNDSLTYSALPLPAGASFDSTTKTFNWQPTPAQAGTYNVTFNVSDATLGDSETIVITVIPIVIPEYFGSLSGRVTEKKGRKTKPIANALVSIADKKTKTNRKGNYTIPDIPIGTHQVGVTKSGYKPSSRQVTIEQDKTIKGDFRLTKTKAGHIQGRVYEGKGKRRRPLSGAKVTIGSQTSITNTNGYYSIRYVTAGKKRVKVTKDGYKSESKKVRIRRNRTKRQNFYLKKK